MSSITIDKPWGNGAHWTIRQRGSEKTLILLTTFRPLFLTGESHKNVLMYLGQKQRHTKPFHLRKTETDPVSNRALNIDLQDSRIRELIQDHMVSHFSFYVSEG